MTHRPAQSAFSLIELLTVISIIAILASFLLAALSSAKAKSRQTACLNNLHQIGLAFTGFSLDHEGKYQMDVPERLGGSLEYNDSRLIENTPFSRDFHHFQVLSNEVPNVKIMVCPADRQRRSASNYQTFTNENLSYWANTKALPHATLSTLAGDWNLYNTATNSNNLDHLAFTSELHRRKGSVLFADGRVEITRSLLVEPQLAPDPIAVTKPATPTAPTAVGGPSARPQPASATPPAAIPTSTPLQSSAPVAPAQGSKITAPSPASDPTPGSAADSGGAAPGHRYRLKQVGDRSVPAPVAVDDSPQLDTPSASPAADDPEPWNTPGFRIFKMFAFFSYLLLLLLALLALLILYLRSRLAQREREQAAPASPE